MISQADRHALLRIARHALARAVCATSDDRSDVTVGHFDPAGVLMRAAGAFVTLRLDGELRGCIGHIEADSPLLNVVARCAAAAASDDPRFPALTPAELGRVAIEVSVLGPLEPVSSLDQLVIGRHGLVVEQGAFRGLLLPQVATEWKWDVDTFVVQACRKAGLPRDAWKHDARLWRFEVEIIRDGE